MFNGETVNLNASDVKNLIYSIKNDHNYSQDQISEIFWDLGQQVYEQIKKSLHKQDNEIGKLDMKQEQIADGCVTIIYWNKGLEANDNLIPSLELEVEIKTTSYKIHLKEYTQENEENKYFEINIAVILLI